MKTVLWAFHGLLLMIALGSLRVDAAVVDVIAESKTIPSTGSVIHDSFDVYLSNLQAGAPELSEYNIHLNVSGPAGFQFESTWVDITTPRPMVFSTPFIFPNIGSFNSNSSSIYADGFGSVLSAPMHNGDGLVRVFFEVPAGTTGTWNISFDTTGSVPTVLSGYNPATPGVFPSAMAFNPVSGAITVSDFHPADAGVPLPSAIAAGLPLLGLLGAMQMIRRRSAA